MSEKKMITKCDFGFSLCEIKYIPKFEFIEISEYISLEIE